MRRLLAAAGLAAVVLLIGAAPAAAHAELTASSPSDGAHLDAAPDEVRLEFSEPVSADLGGLRVFASDGARVDEGAVRSDGTVVAVDLRGDLGDGAYVATYRIVSADGHPVQGGLVFSVGDVDADPALLSEFFDEGADRPWEVAGAVFRYLAYAGTLLAAGGAAFLVLAHDGGPERPRLRRVVVVAAIVGAVGVLAALPIQAALATGEGFGAIFQDGVLAGVLEEGVGWSVLCTLLGLVVVVVADRHTVPVLIGAFLASVGFAFSGHSRSADHELLAVGAAMAHLVAAAVWFGGLVLLALTLRARHHESDGDGPRAAATMVARFSTMAAAAVGVLTLAGLALTWSEVRALSALTSTTYGWTLLAKVGVAVLVGLAAAYNHFRLVPVIGRSPAPRAWHQLRASVRLEALGLVVVLVLTGVLVNITPARTEAGVGGIFSGDLDLDGSGTVNVVVDPNQAGTNQIHLYFYDADGRPAEIPEDAEVTIELSLPADAIGPLTRSPFRAGPSHFQLDSDDLVTGGRWLIGVAVRSRFEAARGEIEVLVAG